MKTRVEHIRFVAELKPDGSTLHTWLVNPEHVYIEGDHEAVHFSIDDGQTPMRVERPFQLIPRMGPR